MPWGVWMVHNRAEPFSPFIRWHLLQRAVIEGNSGDHVGTPFYLPTEAKHNSTMTGTYLNSFPSHSWSLKRFELIFEGKNVKQNKCLEQSWLFPYYTIEEKQNNILNLKFKINTWHAADTVHLSLSKARQFYLSTTLLTVQRALHPPCLDTGRSCIFLKDLPHTEQKYEHFCSILHALKSGIKTIFYVHKNIYFFYQHQLLATSKLMLHR